MCLRAAAWACLVLGLAAAPARAELDRADVRFSGSTEVRRVGTALATTPLQTDGAWLTAWQPREGVLRIRDGRTGRSSLHRTRCLVFGGGHGRLSLRCAGRFFTWRPGERRRLLRGAEPEDRFFWLGRFWAEGSRDLPDGSWGTVYVHLRTGERREFGSTDPLRHRDRDDPELPATHPPAPAQDEATYQHEGRFVLITRFGDPWRNTLYRDGRLFLRLSDGFGFHTLDGGRVTWREHAGFGRRCAREAVDVEPTTCERVRGYVPARRARAAWLVKDIDTLYACGDCEFGWAHNRHEVLFSVVERTRMNPYGRLVPATYAVFAARWPR